MIALLVHFGRLLVSLQVNVIMLVFIYGFCGGCYQPTLGALVGWAATSLRLSAVHGLYYKALLI